MAGSSHPRAAPVESIAEPPPCPTSDTRTRFTPDPFDSQASGPTTDSVDRPLYDPAMIDVRSMTDALAAVPLFGGLDEEGLANLIRGMRLRKFRRNETVFHLGDPGDALFIVMAGAIKITLPADTGDEAILATLRPGDFFGELALLDGAPRSATAVAIEPTETWVLPRDRFRELLATEPVMREAVLATMAAEVRRLTHHVEELHFLDITGRLASRLARMAGESGATPLPDGSIRLAGPLTQGDLAAMIGCTRQSVNKLLGMFTDDGLLRLERDRIVVLDLDGLLRAAHR
jgi:CRP-like cAMP-binding protein